MIQNFSSYQRQSTWSSRRAIRSRAGRQRERRKRCQRQPRINVPSPQQFLPLGPVASQVAIKQLGTNGGGYFNVNAAHPYENPNAADQFFGNAARILLLPPRLPTRSARWSGIRAKAGQFSPRCWYIRHSCWCLSCGETANPRLTALGVDPTPAVNPGGNMEGKEVRFGIAHSRSGGTYHGRFQRQRRTPCMTRSLRWVGCAPVLIQLGEVVFGGVGSGLVRHVGIRDYRGVRRRADGRPHAGIPG